MVEIYLRISRKGAILSTATYSETVTLHLLAPVIITAHHCPRFSFTLKKRPVCGAKHRLWLAAAYLHLFEP